MSTTDQPQGFIANQTMTTPPFVADGTLVDDPVRLVDDPTALVGGLTTIVEGLQTKAEILVPLPRIRINR